MTSMLNIDAYLWIGALVVFGIGDLVTTVCGIRYFGLRETNPVVVRLAGPEPPIVASVVFKAVVLGIAGACYLAVKGAIGNPYAVSIPLVLLGIGTWATHANLLHMSVAALRDGRNNP